MSVATTYNRLIHDLCSTLADQNHGLPRPGEQYALLPIWTISQCITAKNGMCPVVFDNKVVNQAPSACAEKFIGTSMSEGRGYNSPRS